MKKKKRVLVIDDEPEMLNVCSKILVALGYNSIPVQDGESAIKLLQEGDFDLVLSDLLMPGVDGMKILQTTLTYSPNTPVIIFTAYGTVDRAVIAMKNGAFDFIEKPSIATFRFNFWDIFMISIILSSCEENVPTIIRPEDSLNIFSIFSYCF